MALRRLAQPTRHGIDRGLFGGKEWRQYFHCCQLFHTGDAGGILVLFQFGLSYLFER